MRILIEEVVFGRPGIFETGPVGDLDVLPLFLQCPVPGAPPPGPPMLRVVHVGEDPEFHLSPLAHVGAHFAPHADNSRRNGSRTSVAPRGCPRQRRASCPGTMGEGNELSPMSQRSTAAAAERP